MAAGFTTTVLVLVTVASGWRDVVAICGGLVASEQAAMPMMPAARSNLFKWVSVGVVLV
jgi:hypothetical protein